MSKSDLLGSIFFKETLTNNLLSKLANFENNFCEYFFVTSAPSPARLKYPLKSSLKYVFQFEVQQYSSSNFSKYGS